MKSLSLYRHAKTEKESASGRDFDRELTERGLRDSERVGAELGRLALSFDLILASPARRSIGTVEGARLPAPTYEERIYDAPASRLLDIVRQVDDGIERLMLVGHNPGFEHLTSRLTGEEIEMPTGSLIEIELPVERWKDVVEGNGRKVRFIQPKSLD